MFLSRSCLNNPSAFVCVFCEASVLIELAPSTACPTNHNCPETIEYHSATWDLPGSGHTTAQHRRQVSGALPCRYQVAGWSCAAVWGIAKAVLPADLIRSLKFINPHQRCGYRDLPSRGHSILYCRLQKGLEGMGIRGRQGRHQVTPDTKRKLSLRKPTLLSHGIIC